jgi:hypothetical protein
LRRMGFGGVGMVAVAFGDGQAAAEFRRRHSRVTYIS